jgi:hypothetical protein
MAESNSTTKADGFDVVAAIDAKLDSISVSLNWIKRLLEIIDASQGAPLEERTA